MRKFASLTVLASLVILPVSSHAETPAQVSIEFAAPAQILGNFTVVADWAILEFGETSIGNLNWAGVGKSEAEYTNYTWISSRTELFDYELPPASSTSSTELDFSELDAVWSKPGSLVIRGPALELSFSNGTGDILVMSAGEIDRLRTSNSETDNLYQSWAAVSGKSQVLMQATGPMVSLSANGNHIIELLGATTNCTGTSCPRGGAISSTTTGPNRIDQLSFERLSGATGNLTFQGTPLRIQFGAEILAGEIEGAMRLPEASSQSLCDCTLEEDSTLSLSGVFAFEDLHPTDSGRMGSNFVGSDVVARSDEHALAGVRFMQTALVSTAATIGLVALIKFLAIPLFTRLSKAEALEHPKRQLILAYIQEHPGANFREVARQTGIASGTVRHHLTVLERAGHIVEHPHQGTVRLFENHGKFDQSWSDVVLLRESPLAQVHAWLKENPNSPQKDILEAFEVQGWSRSTTQHRLARLVEGGVVSMRLQGRLKIYAAAARPLHRPNGLRGAAGLPSSLPLPP